MSTMRYSHMEYVHFLCVEHYPYIPVGYLIKAVDLILVRVDTPQKCHTDIFCNNRYANV